MSSPVARETFSSALLSVKTKVSPAIIGTFVIGAFALAVIALLTFGGVSFLRNRSGSWCISTSRSTV